ncbi:M48 family metalloprotease [Streptomyces sp. NPDC001890]|uniref:M48 family metalloprotease n=1 Tax=Streptomyces sp. NPDC001890 TaxID=3364620 RepID=UPI0036D0D49B
MPRLILRRYWSHLVIAWTMTATICARWESGTHLGPDTLPMAVIASWAWVLHCVSDLRVQVAEGFRAQHHTWNSILRSGPSHEPSPLYSAFVQRMRSTEEHLRAVAYSHRLHRLTIAFPDSWDQADDSRGAASLQHGRHGHVWLGSNWFEPNATAHLPVVLEHELGHILRRDNLRSTMVQAAGVFLMVLAAAWLPLDIAFLAAAALRLLYTGWLWGSELACDARAVRTCGRDAVIALWTHSAALQSTHPRPVRLWSGLCSAFTHPPYRLRIWWARRTDTPTTHGPHPLATLHDACGHAPTYTE